MGQSGVGESLVILKTVRSQMAPGEIKACKIDDIIHYHVTVPIGLAEMWHPEFPAIISIATRHKRRSLVVGIIEASVWTQAGR